MQEAQNSELQPTQLTQTINPKTLTLIDWLEIAQVVQFDPYWGYSQWIANTSPETKQLLLLEDWEYIAGLLDKSEKWGYHRYKEFSQK